MTRKKANNSLIKMLLLVLTAVAFMIIFPLSAQAAAHYEGEPSKNASDYYVNEDENDYWLASNFKWYQCEVLDNTDSLDVASAKVRSAMINRDDNISFYFVTSNQNINDPQAALSILADNIYKRTDNPASGDYLKMLSRMADGTVVTKMNASDENYSFYYVNISIDSDTTANQEKQVADFVKEWNERYIDSNAKINSVTGDERDYYIVKTIYNFLAKNTTYFTELYKDKAHTLYPVDSQVYKMGHTAYGALFGNIQEAYEDDFSYVDISDDNGAEVRKYNIDIATVGDAQGLTRVHVMNQGKSVCDGYSLLFYYMCRYNGIDCRVVTGDYAEESGLSSDPHAWNMVKLKDCLDTDYEWYAIDATFGSQRSQKISDEFSMVSYDFFLRGYEDESFSSLTHQSAYDEYSDIMSAQSRENYRFNITSINEDKLEIFVSRRRTADANEKFVEDGIYNLENYIIIDPDNNFFKISDDGNERVASDGFSYYGTGYYYSFEIYDFAKGIEYTCDDKFLLSAGSYPFDVTTTIDGKVYSRDINIEPLNMGRLEAYNLDSSTINGKPIATDSTSADMLSISADFTGSAFKLTSKIYDSSKKQLAEGVDYDFVICRAGDESRTPVEAKNPGNYIVCVQYHGNYCGELDIPFEIKKVDLAKFTSSVRETTYGVPIENYISNLTFTNNETGEKIVFVKNVDFAIDSITGGLNVGDTGKIVVKGLKDSQYIKENSIVTWNYIVKNPRDMSTVFNGMTINNEIYDYTGKEIEPTSFRMAYKNSDGDVIELVKDKDYRITGYKNNLNVGKACVNVEFIGNYTGKAELYFTIGASKPRATIITAEPISGGFTVVWAKVDETTGYQIQYGTWSNFGNAATVYGGATNTTSKTITGRAAGATYYIRVRTYKNVNGEYIWGDWSNVIAVTTPSKPAKASVTSISGLNGGFVVNWSKIDGVLGYQVQYGTWSNFGNAATVYGGAGNVISKTITGRAVGARYYVRVRAYKNINGEYVWGDWSDAVSVVASAAKPKATSIKSASGVSGGFTINWNKVSDTTGYQIQYGTWSNFGNAVTVYGGAANTTSKTITGRARGTKYYVRVRTYKNVGGTYIWGDWSAPIAVWTK